MNKVGVLMITKVGQTRLLLLFAIPVLVIASAYYYVRKGPPGVEPRTLPPVSERPLNAFPPLKEGTGESERTPGPATSPLSAADSPGQPAAGIPPRPAWRISHDNPPSIPLPEGIVDYEPVAVDMDSPAFPQPGQQVSLGLPGDESVNATVKTSNENPNGDYSWRGYLDGYGTDYPVVMTYGANSVFATITTPKGSYTLESLNGSGWVYKNPAEFELSDPGKSDYLEPDQPHEHE
jgi:hypothetical protein